MPPATLLDLVLHGRPRRAPTRWPADRTLLHITHDDGLADLATHDPGPGHPLHERLAALLEAGADRREASELLGVSRQRLSQVLPVRGG